MTTSHHLLPGTGWATEVRTSVLRHDANRPDAAAREAIAEWRPIPGFEGRYEANERGQVRSLLLWRRTDPPPRLLSQALDAEGYLRVCLTSPDGGKSRSLRVAPLVVLAFVGPRPKGLEVRHLDGCKTNNAIANLVYGTRSENQRDNVRLLVHPNARKTHCLRGHLFNDTNTRVQVDGHRNCRECQLTHAARYRESKRVTA